MLYLPYGSQRRSEHLGDLEGAEPEDEAEREDPSLGRGEGLGQPADAGIRIEALDQRRGTLLDRPAELGMSSGSTVVA
jgi:hypothetical protein